MGVITEGVEMRAAVLDDAGALAGTLLRNRTYMRPWEPDRHEEFFTEGGQRARMRDQLAQREAGQAMQWVLVETDGGRLVGVISLSRIALGPLCSASVGYWVDGERAGRGIATAAVEAACLAAREEFALHRVEAGTMVDNKASQRVLTKAGFEQYGFAPKYLHANGAWRDHLLFQRILHDEGPRGQGL
ncbi:GNAT family N-acetyltransferase [Streptomyces sp. NPDC127197]|uniref:GNAT family N-acetyltransferase n=1 Tax=Streptomyces sp. NPDC127197 TaxID=3345388 RepID=UPI00362BC019